MNQVRSVATLPQGFIFWHTQRVHAGPEETKTIEVIHGDGEPLWDIHSFQRALAPLALSVNQVTLGKAQQNAFQKLEEIFMSPEFAHYDPRHSLINLTPRLQLQVSK